MKKIALSMVFIALIATNHTNAQKPYNQNGKYGAMYNDGKIFTGLKYDSVFIPEFDNVRGGNVFLVTKLQNKYGVIIFPSDTLPMIIEPKFDTIIKKEYDNYIITKQGNKYGFIVYKEKKNGIFEDGYHCYPERDRVKNVYVSEAEYDSIYNFNRKDGDLLYYLERQLLYKDKQQGLVFHGGYKYINCNALYSYCIIPAIYDSIQIYNKNDLVAYEGYIKYEKFEEEDDKSLHKVSYFVIKVMKDGFVNYLSVNESVADRPMHMLLPMNTYKDDELFYPSSGIFIINQIGKPLQLYNVVDSTYKIITDEQGKAIVLEKYYDFSRDLGNDFSNSVYSLVGVSKDKKEFITIFTNISNKQNSLVFNETVEVWSYNNLQGNIFYQVLGYRYKKKENETVPDFYYDPMCPFTAFIVRDTSYMDNGILMRAFSLFSYPDKRIIYTTTYKNRIERIEVISPIIRKIDCCCHYFQIVKYTNDDERSKRKKRILGYINYKTYEFSKKRPDGCEDDQENSSNGEMYKE